MNDIDLWNDIEQAQEIRRNKMDVNKISDEVILSEFQRRFTKGLGQYIGSSDQAFNYIRGQVIERGNDTEQFYVIFLNGRNEILKIECIFQGTLTTCAIYPREIIKKIIEYKAACVLLVHNHPSGNLTFSGDDLKITTKIKEACATIDVAVHDHVIITTDGYSSMADKGLI